MDRRQRIQRKIVEFQQEWKQLTKRIEAVRHDLASAMDGERAAVLEVRLDELIAKRAQIDSELEQLEQEQQILMIPSGSKRVFISYKRNADPDEALAMYLARFLSDRGKQTFMDQKLKVGIDWVSEIQDQVAQSDFLVVLLSRESMTSEMVLEEVKFADLQWRETGRPRILPIRIKHEGPLPYQLDNYLRPLQYALWSSDADTPDVARRILNAMEGVETLPRYAEVSSETAISQTISKVTAAGSPIVEPYHSFDPRRLETPGFVVDLESHFYIERRADKRLKRELDRDGSTTTICAPHQMGKTSLLVRGVEYARQQGSPIVFFDFQMIDQSYLQTLDVFLRYLALNIALALKIEPEKVEIVWQMPLGSKDRLTRFLEDYVLTQPTPQPIILAIDEADRLFESPFRREFFSLIRAWFTMRAFNSLWRKLNVIMVISTQPYLLIDDINQSPFNVGLRLDLEDFSLDHVRDLNHRHGTPLAEAELSKMIELLGGHSYLIRQALYTLIDEEMTWAELARIAITETGPFNSHLRRYLWQLRDKPQLIAAIKNILLNKEPYADELTLNRLNSAGLIRDDESGKCRLRCQLYDLYFRKCLL